jgi:hypothetical protein
MFLLRQLSRHSNGLRAERQRQRIFSVLHSVQTGSGATQPPLRWLLAVLSSEVKRPGPVTVAERSKACTVFVRSETGIVVSNSTQGMDV